MEQEHNTIVKEYSEVLKEPLTLKYDLNENMKKDRIAKISIKLNNLTR